MEISEEFSRLAQELKTKSGTLEKLSLSKRLDEIEKIALEFGKSWSKSWIGYHSRVYYQDFKAPPVGAVFVQEWGLEKMPLMRNTSGDWKEYKYDEVIAEIYKLADAPSPLRSYLKSLEQNLIPVNPPPLFDPHLKAKSTSLGTEIIPAQECLDKSRSESNMAVDYFEDRKSHLLSNLQVALKIHSDNDYLIDLRKQVQQLQLLRASDFVKSLMPQQGSTRDQIALQEGMRTPPHIEIIAKIGAIKHPFQQCGKLGKSAERISSHLKILEQNMATEKRIGTKIFIGHGHSRIWIDLKELLRERLELNPDDFERISAAGLATKERLIQMLDQAAFAFLVLTGEDEQTDGELQARMNVIHEAGLFQGRLGFEKAIILLEDGCKDFSNIHGLVHIPFPKDNIKASFEDIRKVLEREGIIPSTAK
jgi:predicted nucleotide-binding protein